MFKHRELMKNVLFLFIVILSISCTIDPFLNDGSVRSKKEGLLKESQESVLNLDSDFIVVFGDLQTYTMGRFIEYYKQSCNWIRGQYNAGARIKSILEVGDVTQNNAIDQWLLFKESSDTVSSVIPFFVCVGNHDYSWSSAKIYDRNTTHINDYSHFPETDRLIVTYYKEGDLSNYVANLNVRDSLYLLALEFGPREEVLEWAGSYVSGHPEKQFILMTHEWLNSDGRRISSGSDAELQLKGFSSYSTPEDIWNRVVALNDNVRFVICGHSGFSSVLYSTNCAGRQVPQVLFNLQYVTNGGNGLIQIWEFPIGSSKVNIMVYDTINNKLFSPTSTSFSFGN